MQMQTFPIFMLVPHLVPLRYCEVLLQRLQLQLQPLVLRGEGGRRAREEPVLCHEGRGGTEETRRGRTGGARRGHHAAGRGAGGHPGHGAGGGARSVVKIK